MYYNKNTECFKGSWLTVLGVNQSASKHVHQSLIGQVAITAFTKLTKPKAKNFLYIFNVFFFLKSSFYFVLIN